MGGVLICRIRQVAQKRLPRSHLEMAKLQEDPYIYQIEPEIYSYSRYRFVRGTWDWKKSAL